MNLVFHGRGCRKRALDLVTSVLEHNKVDPVLDSCNRQKGGMQFSPYMDFVCHNVLNVL